MRMAQERISEYKTGVRTPRIGTMDKLHIISRKYGLNTENGLRLDFYIPARENSSE